ncbi:MAG: sigma-70 family RNA polymerase sigma factor [Bacteroidota bacterium]
MNYSTNLYNITDKEIKSESIILAEAKIDIKAFAPLYDKYYIRIFRFVFNRVETENIAADITSQVFYKAIKSLRKYEDRGLPYCSYLYRIARNEINMEARANHIKLVVNAKTSDLENIADEIEGSKEELFTQLHFLLETLNDADLELIEMKYFEKRPYREIAEILNENESNLKVKVHRIIQKLITRLNSKNHEK